MFNVRTYISAFEWDEQKAAANKRKHGVSFDQALEAMEDPRALISTDDEHSDHELREQLLGLSSKGLLLVVYVVRDSEKVIFFASSARGKQREEKR